MRILHLSLGLPPFRTGGLNRYCADLMQQQVEDGQDVLLLYPGEFSFFTQVRIVRQKDAHFSLYKIINPLPLPLTNGISAPERYMKPCDKEVYRSFLKDVKPDVIHVHTLQGFHKELFEAAKELNLRMVYTTHDYYPFCPLCILLDSNGEQCTGNCPEKCVVCNAGRGLTQKQEYLMQSAVYARLKYSTLFKRIRSSQRKHNVKRAQCTPAPQATADAYQQLFDYYAEMMRCINLIHANSEISLTTYKKVYPEFRYKMVPITHAGLKCKALKNDREKPLDISFLGGMDAFKGVDVLFHALEILDAQGFSDWNLWLYGADFTGLCKDKRYHSMGRFTKENEAEVWKHPNHLLVVPSKWMETFSFVVQEGLANGASVVCSDLVGAQLYLPQENIFRHNDAESLANAIQNYNYNVKICEDAVSMKKHSKAIAEDIYRI